MNALAPYLEGFAALPKTQPWLHALKEGALRRAASRGFPTTRDEAWKYTSVAALEKRNFRPSGAKPSLDAATLSSLLIAGLDCPRAVFVNGCFAATLSRLPMGVRIVTAGSADESLRGPLAAPKEWEDDTFLNLNTALFQDALVLELPGDKVLEQPLELLHVNMPDEEPASHYLRCIVKLGTHARATLIERYTGLEAARHLTNSVVQVDLGPGAKLTHLRLQEESTQGFHVGRVLVQQVADSSYISHNVQTGAAWSRLDMAVCLEGPGASVTLNGLYAVNGRQHLDNHTYVDHVAPHTQSRELYRGILDGDGRAVFNGKVRVAKHAVKTDAQQANHNLLLSKGAEIDTKPELEIYADDVKCAHGATVGQLDEQQLFYLRSRGLDMEEARALLVNAFVEHLVAALPLPALTVHVRNRLGKSICQLAMQERS